MCREYESLPALIAIWGNLSWQKSQFFFAVESVFLAGIGVALKDTFVEGKAPAPAAFLMLVGACVFNFWICYVWFRTNRSNREYLNPLLQRAQEIEVALLNDKADKATFSAQSRSLREPERKRHSSERWERHLPTGFAAAWAAALLAAAAHGPYCGWALGTLVPSLLALLLFELFHPSRTGPTKPAKGGTPAAS
jgi:hypothetical protein